MKNKIKLLTLSTILFSSGSYAANYAIEARGDAMGGVGVVSATFLTAPFYNPALVAIYRRNDDVGMIAPSIGFSYDDQYNMVDDLETISDILDNPTLSRADELNAALSSIDGSIINAELGGVVAFAIPNQFISANVYGKAYTETFSNPIISNSCNNTTPDCTFERAQNSSVNAVSVAVMEVGISLGKYQTFMGHHIAFGITPKLQRINTYVYEASMSSYDLIDVADNSTSQSMFNFDAGAVWFHGPFRVGLAASDMISQDIETKIITSSVTGNPISYKYEMRPQFTVGAGIVADYFTVSVDYDLNERKRYANFDDNTKMIRVGGEVDLLRQLKLRAGYNKNLAYENSEGTLTAGVGLSPLNLFQLDVAASYTNENAMGVYVNFLASY